MPRLSNRPPQMTRYSGNKARVCLHGKYHYLGLWGSEKAKAKYNALIEQWRKDQAAEQTPIGDRYLVAELTADYIAHLREYFGAGHNRATSIIPVIKRFGLHFGEMWTDEFRPRHLEQARDIWIKRRCSRVYINRAAKDIVRCFQWGVTKDKVPAGVCGRPSRPYPSLALGRYGVREALGIKPVPLDVVAATLPFLPEKVADMARLQLLTGCRPHEIMRLTPGEIDRSGDVWRYTPAKHKNAWRKKTRTIHFGPQAQRLLAKYLFQGPTEPCFTTKFGTAYARDGYAQEIGRGVRRANKHRQQEAEKAGTATYEKVMHWTPGQLRHTKATRVAEDEEPRSGPCDSRSLEQRRHADLRRDERGTCDRAGSHDGLKRIPRISRCAYCSRKPPSCRNCYTSVTCANGWFTQPRSPDGAGSHTK